MASYVDGMQHSLTYLMQTVYCEPILSDTAYHDTAYLLSGTNVLMLRARGHSYL